MRSIFARYARKTGEPSRTNVFKTDEANPDNGVTVMQFGTEIRWQQSLNNVGSGSIIDEQPSLDNPMDERDSHAGPYTIFRNLTIRALNTRCRTAVSRTT